MEKKARQRSRLEAVFAGSLALPAAGTASDYSPVELSSVAERARLIDH
jgi:hypothetical protein